MRKIRKLVSLLCAMVMVFALVVGSASAASIDNEDEDVIIATKSFYIVENIEDGTFEVIEGDIPVPYGSSYDFLHEYNATGNITLCRNKKGSEFPYSVVLTLTALNHYTIDRIVLEIRPNDTNKWSKLDKSYSDKPKTVTESIGFTYTGKDADLSVEAKITDYTDYGGLIFDNVCHFWDITLD